MNGYEAGEQQAGLAKLAGGLQELEQAIERLMEASGEYLLTAAGTWRSWREGGAVAGSKEAEELVVASCRRLLECRTELAEVAIVQPLSRMMNSRPFSVKMSMAGRKSDE